MVMSLALLHTSARISWTEFSVHPSTVIGIVGLAGLFEYARRREASGETRREAPATAAAARRAPIASRFLFHGALVIMFLSLNGPIHDLSDSYLFSAHMVQHLVLAFVVAPMLLMAVTGDMLRPLIRNRHVRRLAEWGLAPTRCFAIFNIVIAGWHLPPMYNYALAHHSMHIAQHLMILAASVIMWWPVLSPLPELPRLSYPGQMLYLFLMSIPMAIVSVYIAYSDGILYPMYASAPRVWGISPMNDQMIGGLIMWIPGGLFFYTVISIVFFRWNQRGAEDSQAGAQVDWGSVPPSELAASRIDG
jgi:putative membrane protein